MEKQLKVEQIADILGLAEDTIRDYFQASKFPGAYKIGYDWRLGENDLERWISFKKNPKRFIEREIEVLRKSPEYLNEEDPVIRGIKEKSLIDEWDRARYGRKRNTVIASFDPLENLKKKK